MKKIIFFLAICLFGCDDAKHFKYKEGDVVYLKPDSTKGVIDKVDISQSDYRVTIGYQDGAFANNEVYIDEAMIYEKKPQTK